MPWDTEFERQKVGLGAGRDQALANNRLSRQTLSQSYGFNEDGTENTADPFSRLATLRADYEKIKRGGSASYAARGLGYDGAYQNLVEGNLGRQNRSYDALRKAYGAEKFGLDQQEAGINDQYSRGLSDLTWQRIRAAASAQTGGAA